MQVLVFTYAPDSDVRESEPIAHKTIHWNDSSDRKWLMNHLHHCMMNNKSVLLETRPESN